MHSLKSAIFSIAVILVSFMPERVAAQAQRTPTPNDTLNSPIVRKDNTVLFQIYAPKAGEVILRGDWIEGTDVVSLVKDSSGVWSAGAGPIPPDLYSYSFYVDGVRVLDPKNPMIKQGISSLDNMFFMPGKESDFENIKDVPHGDITKVWYKSSTIGTQRRMHVYTPPNYDGTTNSYPVFYLLHGGGDEDSGWSTIGRAGFIMDNLLADGMVTPMIIVMPNGSLPRPENFPTARPGTTPSADFLKAYNEMQARFTNELMRDIIPTIESKFRIKASPENRAIAGLSMGGGQTTRVLLTNPDKFGYVSIWSAGMFRQPVADFEKENSAFLNNPDLVNRTVKNLTVAVGDKDFAFEGSKALSETLSKHGIKNELKVSGGGHTWINWRHYLYDLLPVLFK